MIENKPVTGESDRPCRHPYLFTTQSINNLYFDAFNTKLDLIFPPPTLKIDKKVLSRWHIEHHSSAFAQMMHADTSYLI